MNLNEWARRWGVSVEALTQLCEIMGINETATSQPGVSESAIQQEIRLETNRRGNRLWRNNVGALKDISGRVVRYGLNNESKRINEVIKSSDLIGITPRVIVKSDVGGIIGVFTSIECKHSGWSYTGTTHEQAQLKWIQLILKLGGIAQFAASTGDIWHD